MVKFFDKRGTDKMLSIYWFIILFIVAAAIVYMVLLFYGKPYDVREVEANILANKISDCFVEKNYFKNEVLSESFKANFLAECGLNFNVEDTSGWNNDQHYVEVEIFDFNSQNTNNEGSLRNSFVEGNSNLKDCSNELDNNPFCVERRFYSLDEQGSQYTIKILASVRKTEKNVA